MVIKQDLVEVLATASSSTCAGDFVVLYGEFVVIGQLLPTKYSPKGKDDDVFLTQDVHHTRVAVGLCGSKLVTSNSTDTFIFAKL